MPLLLPAIAAHAQSSAHPEALVGTYHASINGETKGRDGATAMLMLARDGRYVVTLANDRDTGQFRGQWHRAGDKVVFEDVENDPAITLENTGAWNDAAQGHAQSVAEAAEYDRAAKACPFIRMLTFNADDIDPIEPTNRSTAKAALATAKKATEYYSALAQRAIDAPETRRKADMERAFHANLDQQKAWAKAERAYREIGLPAPERKQPALPDRCVQQPQDAAAGSMLAIAFEPVAERNLSLSTADLAITVHFDDGKMAQAEVDADSTWAIARDLGDVQSIDIAGGPTPDDGDIVVPVAPDKAGDRVFTLRLHPIVMVIGSEPPPPLKIDGKMLVFDKSMTFVKDAE